MTLINCHVIGAELTVELGTGTGSSVCFSVCLFCHFMILVVVIACQILALWLVSTGSRSGTHTHTHSQTHTHTHIFNNSQDQTHNSVQLPAFIGHLSPLLLLLLLLLLLVLQLIVHLLWHVTQQQICWHWNCDYIQQDMEIITWFLIEFCQHG